MKLIGQSFAILLSTAIVFAVTNTQLSDYLVYFLAFVIIISVAYMMLSKNKSVSEATGSSSLFVFMITTGILFIIFLTGGLSSTLFFLTYFLLFGITFLFEPATVFVFLISLVVLFFQLALKDDVVLNLIKLGSLILLAPLAYFFGVQNKKQENLAEEVEKASTEIAEAADELLYAGANKLNQKDVEKIDNILEKADELKKQAQK
ncbi:hypothetical protein M1349_05305 [Patescibacteria group bacterium]|nr:hypothetical protein [Patescibacteria group bacterium]